MAREPEIREEYPEDIVSDREIRPLASERGKVPTIFFIIAAAGGILLLLLVQLLGGGGNDRVDETPTRVLTPNLTPPVVDIRPPDPVPPVAEELEEDRFEQDRLNALELERLRQQALLDEKRLELQQARAQAAAERERRRFQSDMLVVDRGGTAPTQDDALGANSAFGPDAFNSSFADDLSEPDPNERNVLIEDQNNRFLRDAAAETVVKASAALIPDQDFTLSQGTFISGILETMINSDLPGMARAIVDKPVYSMTGSRILIPKGSRLIGRYNSGVDTAQSRVYIVWTRLERPDGAVIDIGSPGTDSIGQIGLGGDVDRHLIERFGASTLYSTLGPGLALLVGDQANSFESRQIVQGAQNSFEQTAAIALRDSIRIPPTIRVAQGTEISIFVNRDLSFATVN